MRKQVVAALVCGLLAAASVFAQSFTPFTIRDIRVEGLQRTEPGTVFSYLPVKVGETMTEEKAQQALLETSEQELKRQYLSRGKYGAEVQTTVTPLERNRVGINIAVNEGDVARISSINIVGAQSFREKDLLELFVLRTPGWLTWYTK